MKKLRLLGDRTAAINYVKTHAGRLAILQAIDDLLPNYYELQTQYAKALKDRRGVKKPPVEVKGININPFKDADAVAYLSVVNADPDAVMPLPALRNGNMLAKEKH
ncbi:MAG: hypothetical protein H6773_04500 [Pseudomonadales bacterium]|nr:hypothetical protein [Pseudomonadales bacterium]